jgi:hypothetical protein
MDEHPAIMSNILTCGVMMPISAVGGCPESHWKEVRKILFKAIDNAGFNPQMVSDGEGVELIAKRMVNNLFQNEIAVCDISANNPNVMFELGIRVAFRRPVIIVKDDMTPFSFDIAGIEHLEYPRDLQRKKMNSFTSRLSDKIIHTYQASVIDPEYNDLIGGMIKSGVSKLQPIIALDQKNVADSFKFLKAAISDTKTGNELSKFVVPSYKTGELDKIERAIKLMPGVLDLIPGEGSNRPNFKVILTEDADREVIRAAITGLLT